MSKLPHQCEECGDEGSLYLSPRCHQGSPVFCVLTGDVLTMECAQCRLVVARVRDVSGPVAEEEAHGE